jgi:hypothetical protein
MKIKWKPGEILAWVGWFAFCILFANLVEWVVLGE